MFVIFDLFHEGTLDVGWNVWSIHCCSILNFHVFGMDEQTLLCDMCQKNIIMAK